MAKSKEIYVVYGVGVNDDKNYTYDFCKVFNSEKKADKYYDEEYTKLLEMYSIGLITYYNIDWQKQKIK